MSLKNCYNFEDFRKIAKKTNIDGFEAASLRKFAKYCMFVPRFLRCFAMKRVPESMSLHREVAPQKQSQKTVEKYKKKCGKKE